MPTTTARILTHILGHCQPGALPPWLPRPFRAPNYWRLVIAPAELLADLQRTFPADELVRSGVAFRRRDAQASCFLHPALGESGQSMIALVNADGDPYDLLLPGGCLRQPGPALFGAYRDRHFSARLAKTHTIFIAANIDDAAVLRALNLSAITIAGLDRLGGTNLDRFRSLFPQYGDPWAGDDGSASITMIVVDWMISSRDLATPVGVDRVVQHLHGLHLHLDFPLDSVMVWRPTDDQFNRFDFVVRHAQPKNRTRRILELVQQSAQPLIQPPRPTLASAVEQLVSAAKDHMNPDGLTEAWSQWKKLMDEHMVQPLIREAESASNPAEKNMRLILADLLEEIQLLQIRQRVRRERPARGQKSFQATEEMDALMAKTNLVLKLQRAIQRCTETPNSIQPFRKGPFRTPYAN